MAWKWTLPEKYPGVQFDVGKDTYYIPITGKEGLYYSSKLIPNEVINRLELQTGGNSYYIIRPYSQSNWKPNVTKPQVTKNSKAPTGNPRVNRPSKTNKPRTVSKAPASDSWINKNKKIWNYNGVSQADVANAYKTGDFSKVRNYLSQHKDLTSYLNNIYSKRGGNQFNLSTQTPTVNTMTLQTLDNIVPKSPVKEITPTAELPTAPTPTYNRSQTRDYMRSIGMNPYDYSGGERKALRTYLNNPGFMDSKYQLFINQVQNQRTQKMVDSIGTNQLLKPETDTNKLNNQLVNLKFKQGGILKFQNGGANQNQIMEAFKQWVTQKLQNGELEESDLSKEKLAQLYQTFIKEQQGVQTAMNGAKLNYINKLNGKCPQGTHLSYYRIGGTLCKKCEADAYNESSDPIKAFKQKCGGKVKKAAKQKCGGKVKKKELGGEVDNKKNQPKPKLVKKPQNKIIPKKPQNPRPGPRDLKTLPNGKYPKYWTADQRGQWDRDHNEGD